MHDSVSTLTATKRCTQKQPRGHMSCQVCFTTIKKYILFSHFLRPVPWPKLVILSHVPASRLSPSEHSPVKVCLLYETVSRTQVHDTSHLSSMCHLRIGTGQVPPKWWWCPTLCSPMDCSPPGSSVHGLLQARVLEWVAMPSSRGSSQSRD